jgi:hypothetical protein
VSATPICPCQPPAHPRRVANPPGLDALDYRIGDYAAFRRALLVPRANEVALAGWHPGDGPDGRPIGGDLGLQLLEWWAYLADVLVFYNERALTEVLLRTAVHAEDVRRIIRLLGYRPRPAIGATGVVAALLDSPDPIVVPRGFAIEGAAGSGPPQIFETDGDVELGVLGRPLPPFARIGRPETEGAAASTDTSTTTVSPVGRSRARTVARDGGGRVKNKAELTVKVKRTPAVRAGETVKVTLDGVVASVKRGDVLLFLRKGWLGEPWGYSVTIARGVDPRFDLAGPPVTDLQVQLAHSLPEGALGEYRILRPSKLAHLWLYHERYPGTTSPGLIEAAIAAQVVKSIFDPLGLFHGGGFNFRVEDPRVLAGFAMQASPPPHGTAHLEAICRGLKAGDPVLFEKKAGGGVVGMFQQLFERAIDATGLAALRMLVMQLVRVTGYAEDIWYAEAPQMDRIGMGPPVGPTTHGLLESGGGGPIPIPHSRINFDPNPMLDLMSLGDLQLNTIVVHYGWEEVGLQVTPASGHGGGIAISLQIDHPADTEIPAIVTDKNGRGKLALVGTTADLTTTTTTAGTAGEETVELVGPFEALINLLPITRGQTIRGETLGVGDPTAAHQEFALKRVPLTYLGDVGPGSTDGYRSTMRIRVDGIEWREVPSFYGQLPDARVFVTREDEQQRTHVRFGDGVRGARLPAGARVIADYRCGGGAAVPPVGTLRSIVKPRPGLKSIVDPLPVGGGADPDSPAQIRRYAPRSVLTFGRAISGDDYEAVAAQTPGVRRAQASWSWDAGLQRTLVKVFVGDDEAAVTAARGALGAFGDPNRPVVVALATPVIADLTLHIEVHPDFDAEAVREQVAAALLDPRGRPFGTEVVRIGDAIYNSEIHDACLRVPGVVAIHSLSFGVWSGEPVPDSAPPTPPTPPPDQIVKTAFGPGYIVDDAFNPLTLAVRLGVPEETLYDPVALAARLAERTPEILTAGDAAPEAARFVETVKIEAGVRHLAGEGAFYVLREDRLHLTAELARHAL